MNNNIDIWIADEKPFYSVEDDVRILIKAGNDNIIVCCDDLHTAKQKTAFVVKACNNYDKLVEALKNVMSELNCYDWSTVFFSY